MIQKSDAGDQKSLRRWTVFNGEHSNKKIIRYIQEKGKAGDGAVCVLKGEPAQKNISQHRPQCVTLV